MQTLKDWVTVVGFIALGFFLFTVGIVAGAHWIAFLFNFMP